MNTEKQTKKRNMSWLLPFASILLFAGIATTLWLGAFAADFAVAPEAEDGSLSPKASVANMADTSGGSAVQFRHEFGTLVDRRPEGNPRFTYRLFGGDDNPIRIPEDRRNVYDVYLLSTYMVNIAQAIKDTNPDAVTLMYKDASSARGDSPTDYGGWCSADGGTIGHDWGVDYCDAYANHPEWFMTHQGSYFEYNGYPHHWHMDVMAAGYKERWLSNVLADLQHSSVWDGVFVDNMLSDIRAYVPGRVFPDQYATLEAGHDAYADFMDFIGPELKAQGFAVVGNDNDVRLYPGLWERYTRNASGGYDEFWTTFGGTASEPNNLPLYGGVGWEAHAAEMETMAAQSKLGIAVAQDNGGVCTECTKYGFASYLLVNDGRQTYQQGYVDTPPDDFVASTPMLQWQLGNATSPRTEIETNVFQRTFDHGMAIVNADNNATHTITLPGTYLDEAGNPQTSVTLGPTRGTVLRTQ
ncbi:hypothetical protein CR970_02830 [Candidatus Saccharibacteria bacterium]|nr:MAG: hypothetical protein CR970_02830 [Candidatus Saccharibacteria bacterium]